MDQLGEAFELDAPMYFPPPPKPIEKPAAGTRCASEEAEGSSDKDLPTKLLKRRDRNRGEPCSSGPIPAKSQSSRHRRQGCMARTVHAGQGGSQRGENKSSSTKNYRWQPVSLNWWKVIEGEVAVASRRGVYWAAQLQCTSLQREKNHDGTCRKTCRDRAASNGA